MSVAMIIWLVAMIGLVMFIVMQLVTIYGVATKILSVLTEILRGMIIVDEDEQQH